MLTKVLNMATLKYVCMATRSYTTSKTVIKVESGMIRRRKLQALPMALAITKYLYNYTSFQPIIHKKKKKKKKKEDKHRKKGKRRLNSLEGRGVGVFCFKRYGEEGSPLMTSTHDNGGRKRDSKSQKPYENGAYAMHINLHHTDKNQLSHIEEAKNQKFGVYEN